MGMGSVGYPPAPPSAPPSAPPIALELVDAAREVVARARVVARQAEVEEQQAQQHTLPYEGPPRRRNLPRAAPHARVWCAPSG